MVSETAIEDVAALEADGLRPTVRDIVRLNALALKIERGAQAPLSIYSLPRVAFLPGVDVRLYEPTVAHEMWLSRVGRVMAMEEPSTNLAVTAFALSFADADALPDAEGKVRLMMALWRFRRRIRTVTPRQIAAAARWVCEGRDAASGEYPPPSKGAPVLGEEHSIALGVALRATSLVAGLSVGDAMRLTTSQLLAMIARAVPADAEDVRSEAFGDYMAALDEIRARLLREKENNG